METLAIEKNIVFYPHDKDRDLLIYIADKLGIECDLKKEKSKPKLDWNYLSTLSRKELEVFAKERHINIKNLYDKDETESLCVYISDKITETMEAVRKMDWFQLRVFIMDNALPIGYMDEERLSLPIEKIKEQLADFYNLPI